MRDFGCSSVWWRRIRRQVDVTVGASGAGGVCRCTRYQRPTERRPEASTCGTLMLFIRSWSSSCTWPSTTPREKNATRRNNCNNQALGDSVSRGKTRIPCLNDLSACGCAFCVGSILVTFPNPGVGSPLLICAASSRRLGSLASKLGFNSSTGAVATSRRRYNSFRAVRPPRPYFFSATIFLHFFLFEDF